VLPFVGAIYQLATDPRAPGVVSPCKGGPSRGSPSGSAALARTALEDLKLGAAAADDYSNLVAEETTANSRDGTAVPLSIIHRKDSSPDRTAAAVLDGYGGYGISEQPFFDPLMLEWVEAGHVFAVAHVRGGGEKKRRPMAPRGHGRIQGARHRGFHRLCAGAGIKGLGKARPRRGLWRQHGRRALGQAENLARVCLPRRKAAGRYYFEPTATWGTSIPRRALRRWNCPMPLRSRTWP
jgi:hypothetical protein